MSRQWRIEFEGALYHVMSRGNDGQNIFTDDGDRKLFLYLIEQMCERFHIEIHAWVLMNNHYHLLLRTMKANLSKGMQWLGITYTRRYNIKHRRQGHLYQGRFKSILVENEYYLFSLSCYIHRNPLRANMVKRLSNYKWSSYKTYAYGDTGILGCLTTNLILSQLSDNDLNKAYRLKVQQYSNEAKDVAGDIHLGIVVGTKNYAKKIKKEFKPAIPDKEIPLQKKISTESNMATIIDKASNILECDIDIFRNSQRISQKDKPNRDLIIFLLWKTGAYTNEEIGRQFGMTYSNVSRRMSIIKKTFNKDKEFKNRYEKIKSLIKM